jgi:hypothetical protein
MQADVDYGRQHGLALRRHHLLDDRAPRLQRLDVRVAENAARRRPAIVEPRRHLGVALSPRLHSRHGSPRCGLRGDPVALSRPTVRGATQRRRSSFLKIAAPRPHLFDAREIVRRALVVAVHRADRTARRESPAPLPISSAGRAPALGGGGGRADRAAANAVVSTRGLKGATRASSFVSSSGGRSSGRQPFRCVPSSIQPSCIGCAPAPRTATRQLSRGAVIAPRRLQGLPGGAGSPQLLDRLSCP